LIDDATAPAADADRAAAPSTGALVALEEAGVEMQIQDDPVVPAEAGIARHHTDVVDRARIAGDRLTTFVVEHRRFLARYDRDGFVR
jgi:hypothetical protein